MRLDGLRRTRRGTALDESLYVGAAHLKHALMGSQGVAHEKDQLKRCTLQRDRFVGINAARGWAVQLGLVCCSGA